MRSRCRYCGINWLAKACNVSCPDQLRFIIRQQVFPSRVPSSKRSLQTVEHGGPEGGEEPKLVPVQHRDGRLAE